MRDKLRGIDGTALREIFQLIAPKEAVKIWNEIPDPTGTLAWEILHRSNARYPENLVHLLWPRLEGYIASRLFQSDETREELISMKIHDAFVERTWPFVLRAMLELGKPLIPSDERLASHYIKDAHLFQGISMTSLALRLRHQILHPNMKYVKIPHYDRQNINEFYQFLALALVHADEIRADEGIVEPLLDIVADTKPPGKRIDYVVDNISFPQMVWVARWWVDGNKRAREIRIKTRQGERWNPPRQIPHPDEIGPMDGEGPPRVMPYDPPLRGLREFEFDSDAGWILNEAELRKERKRKKEQFCPKCKQYDPAGEHLRPGYGYSCETRKFIPKRQPSRKRVKRSVDE